MFLFEHDLRANAFGVCREGKPVRTFPDHALEPDIDQHEIGRAGEQQCDRKGQLRALAEGMEARFHGGKHPAILAGESRGFFFAPFTSR
jgi:hypothetical protein